MKDIREYLGTMDVELAAQRLLGSTMVRSFDGGESRVKIVETEAYHQTDAASHSYRGRTQRTDVMFGPAGRLYVYFTYGMHNCCNVVTGPEGEGSAVLIRAVEPISGEQLMRTIRTAAGTALSNGPAKLCQALGIDTRYNGHDLAKLPIRLELEEALHDEDIIRSTRIGISKAVDVPWRFHIRGNPYVSKA